MTAQFEQAVQHKARTNLWVELLDENEENPEIYELLDVISSSNLDIAAMAIDAVLRPDHGAGHLLRRYHPNLLARALHEIRMLLSLQRTREQQQSGTEPRTPGAAPIYESAVVSRNGQEVTLSGPTVVRGQRVVKLPPVTPMRAPTKGVIDPSLGFIGPPLPIGVSTGPSLPKSTRAGVMVTSTE